MSLPRFVCIFLTLLSVPIVHAEAEPSLLISTYVTVGQTRQLAHEADFQAEALEKLRAMQIQRVYLEFYRGGTELETEELEKARDFLLAHDFDVVGGIATVPGGDFGVRQDRGYGWFNWQHPKTQEDLIRVMARAAAVFDTIIVDDFLCTDDQSEISEAAKGDRDWGAYRRDLLVELSQRLFVDPVRAVNPEAHIIIKYPQWYGLFHRFGYEPARMSPLYDETYVGTETRGPHTPRFGFVPPYLGFNNFRWLADVAGEPVKGAWFDHGDCDAEDFRRQAWYSVLAGARELILFSYAAIRDGHPGHALFLEDLEGLNQLAARVAEGPVDVIHAYMPVNGEAGNDLYLFDFLGMEGVPLAPVSQYPVDADALILFAASAHDGEIVSKLEASLKQGATVVVTANFLDHLGDRRDPVCNWAGVEIEEAGPFQAAWEPLRVNPGPRPVQRVAAKVLLAGAESIVSVSLTDGKDVAPLMTTHSPEAFPGATIVVLNTSTYTQADFDAIEEVLLAPGPRDFSLLAEPLQTLFGYDIQSPSGVSRHPLKGGTFFWNATDEEARLTKQKEGAEQVVLGTHAGIFVEREAN